MEFRKVTFAVVLVILLTRCGYTLRSRNSPLFEREGIHAVYVEPVKNGSFQPGADVLVRNELVKAIVARGRLRWVNSREAADVALRVTVDNASASASAAPTAASLEPKANALNALLPVQDVIVATEYSAVLSVSFGLDRVRPRPDQSKTIWATSLSRSRVFTGANQLDVPGTTSPLINQTSLARALQENARDISLDLQDTLFDLF